MKIWCIDMRIKLLKKTMKGRGYTTYQVSLPKSIIESIGWKDLEELELEVKPEGEDIILILRKPKA
jgi:hypothetical protein